MLLLISKDAEVDGKSLSSEKVFWVVDMKLHTSISHDGSA